MHLVRMRLVVWLLVLGTGTRVLVSLPVTRCTRSVPGYPSTDGVFFITHITYLPLMEFVVC